MESNINKSEDTTIIPQNEMTMSVKQDRKKQSNRELILFAFQCQQVKKTDQQYYSMVTNSKNT